MKTLLRFGAALAIAAFLVPSVASAALTDSQVSSILSLLRSFGADASTVAAVDAALQGAPPASPSCTVSSSAQSVAPGQQFTVSWQTNGIETPVMMVDDGTKRFALAGASGTSAWTAGPKAPQYVFSVGYGASGVAPFSPACSVTVKKR